MGLRSPAGVKMMIAILIVAPDSDRGAINHGPEQEMKSLGLKVVRTAECGFKMLSVKVLVNAEEVDSPQENRRIT
jgi:hypothetical protein